MTEDLIQKSIDEVGTNPCINWNDPSLIERIPDGSEYQTYILNRPINDKLQCGYYTLIHTLVKGLAENSIILEVGNREGLSTLTIFDALKSSHKFITVDIEEDLRFVPPRVFEDPRVSFGIGDCLDHEVFQRILKRTSPKKVDLVFFDTIHTYEQINAEYNNFKPLLSQDCIILVDDINLADKGKFYEEWEGPKWKLGYNFHGPAGFAVFCKKNDE